MGIRDFYVKFAMNRCSRFFAAMACTASNPLQGVAALFIDRWAKRYHRKMNS